MRITLAQVNPTVGDVKGNVAMLADVLERSRPDAPDLVVLPELFLCGYPPKDLLERAWFVDRVVAALEDIKRLSVCHPDVGILFGAPLPTWRMNGKELQNAALLVWAGKLRGVAAKTLLPTYDVFDEARYFAPASDVGVIPFKGERLGVHICEDAWNEPELWGQRNLYAVDPVGLLVERGASLLINISASPFSVGKEQVRHCLVSAHARRHRIPFLYVNQVGANDELVFDGRSLALDGAGRMLAVLDAFETDQRTVDTQACGANGYTPQEPVATVHDALVLGIRDYCRKCGFKQAVLGLSGGIDSAVTAVLATRALGATNVLGVSMPSQYSSRGSLDDARQLAANLGIGYQVIPISDTHQAYLQMLAEQFAGRAPDTTEENIQARIRGNILMAISNKFGHLVLSTGNKSELSVGYCTLYGDMSGGLAAISDVPKQMVYELARFINREQEIVPQSSISKPPSAELRPNQTDQDTLPPYPVLDEILRYYVEEAYSVEQIAALGFDEQTVRWVARTVDRNEYKRKQAAPGLRVTTKAFGVGRRMPIAARY
jgi:NAD+ synthase (glutamine-hydrolysing)